MHVSLFTNMSFLNKTSQNTHIDIHVPRYHRTWPTTTKFKLLINNKSEIKVRYLAFLFHFGTKLFETE